MSNGALDFVLVKIGSCYVAQAILKLRITLPLASPEIEQQHNYASLCPVAVWQGSCITLKCVPFCSWLLPFCFASNHSKSNEDLRQQNSELEEKLRVLVAEKAAAELRVQSPNRICALV